MKVFREPLAPGSRARRALIWFGVFLLLLALTLLLNKLFISRHPGIPYAYLPLLVIGGFVLTVLVLTITTLMHRDPAWGALLILPLLALLGISQILRSVPLAETYAGETIILVLASAGCGRGLVNSILPADSKED